MGNGIPSILFYLSSNNICNELLEAVFFLGGEEITHDLISPSLSCGSGWRKAAVSLPRWDSTGKLGLQYLWPEELLPRRSPAICPGTYSCRGHGSTQYGGAAAGAPQRPAGPLPSPWWGLYEDDRLNHLCLSLNKCFVNGHRPFILTHQPFPI